MKNKKLTAIVVLAVLGLLFSGYLSFVELFGSRLSCPAISSVLGVPVCVVGFVFYAAILVLAILMWSKQRR